MRKDILQRRRTVTELQNMLEKELASHYHVCRDTARKARKAVLSESEFVEQQIATNDNSDTLEAPHTERLLGASPHIGEQIGTRKWTNA
jgi:hypothetical protein